MITIENLKAVLKSLGFKENTELIGGGGVNR